MNTAEKLIKLREEKGLTQYGLSRELNIAISSIKNYENVKKPRIPEAKLLLKIAKYYDVSLEYLLDDELNNRKQENISIEKDLKLNDEAIASIKEMSEYKLINDFNLFISDVEFSNIIFYLFLYCNLEKYNSLFYNLTLLSIGVTSNRAMNNKSVIKYIKETYSIIDKLKEEVSAEQNKYQKRFENIEISMFKANDCDILYKNTVELEKKVKLSKSSEWKKSKEYIEYDKKLHKMQRSLSDCIDYITFMINKFLNNYIYEYKKNIRNAVNDYNIIPEELIEILEE